MNAFRRKVLLTSLAALVYEIWKARNQFIWAEEEFTLEKLIGRVKTDVKNRIAVISCKKVGDIDWEWFLQL